MVDMRAVQKRKTARAAHAFVEDMKHFRAVLGNSQYDNREVRQISIPLRRLLSNGELRDIAAPRMNRRLMIMAIDLKHYYERVGRGHRNIMVAGNANIFGIPYSTMIVNLFMSASETRTRRRMENFEKWPVMPSETFCHLNLSNFAQQRVCHFSGQWITRNEVIKHVANFGSVAHTSQRADAKSKWLDKFENAFRLSVDDTGEGFHLSLDDILNQNYTKEESQFIAPGKYIDALSIQLLTTVAFLTTSPDLIALEAAIKAEQKI